MNRKTHESSTFDDGPDFESITTAVRARLAKNSRVRRNLPGDGRLRIDRQLPFLCVYRSHPDIDDRGTRELVTTAAAYLFAAGAAKYHDGLSRLCQEVNSLMQEHFGTFLFLEIWEQSDNDDADHSNRQTAPRFDIYTTQQESLPSTIEVLVKALQAVTIDGHQATVAVHDCDLVAPPGLQPLDYVPPERREGGCCVVGVAVKPIYRDAVSGALYPVLLHTLRWQLSYALRKAIAQFTGVEAGSDEVHYESLGPSSLVKAVRIVDQQLCEVAESFDFLLQVTPLNSDAAWREFQSSGYQEIPPLRYRPVPYHPSILKRRLFAIEIERIEDPTLAHLFWEKQIEVDRQLSAIRDLDSSEFLYSSLQLYGGADPSLVALAQNILDSFPVDLSASLDSETVHISVNDFVVRAHEEIDYYRQRLTTFTAKVEVCNTIASGVMVSRDRLLISENLKVRPERVAPLLHHEIGTHLLTYFNGRCQPFQQLYSGLAGYEGLQEGLAVLAEYACGGLTSQRMRNLAARVIAVNLMASGISFAETFSVLHNHYEFAPREAFITTIRVYRGGGLTKDIIYLRGLRDLLTYFESGHDLEPLYVGKIGLQHLPYIQELRRRGIINAPSIMPRFWNDETLRSRLDACRGMSVLQLMETN